MDEMDEKEITFGQLLQARCPMEKKIMRKQNGSPNHVPSWGTFLKEKGNNFLQRSSS
jgi:hypothetical protein